MVRNYNNQYLIVQWLFLCFVTSIIESLLVIVGILNLQQEKLDRYLDDVIKEHNR